MPSKRADSAHISLADLARAAQVSQATASRALRDQGHVSALVKARVKEVAARIGYRPNPLVASLMRQVREGQVRAYQGTITLVAPSASRADWNANLVGPKFWAGVSAEAERQGFHAELALPHAEGFTRRRLIEILQARGCAGAITMEFVRRQGGEPVDELDLEDGWLPADSLPVVLVGHREHHIHASFALADQYANARLLGQQLLRRGYRRPLLCTTSFIETLTERRLAFGLESAGSAGWLALHHIAGTSASRLGLGGADDDAERRLLLHSLRKHEADVVVSVYPEILDWLRKEGVEVPGRLGFASLDWSPDRPGIAGIDQNHERVGVMAMRQLAEEIAVRPAREPASVVGRLVPGLWREAASLRPAPPRPAPRKASDVD